MRRLLIRLLGAALTAGAALGVAGCTGRPAPADPALARQILNKALDAWKQGEAPDDLQKGNPAIVVADREWAAGKKLVDYQVDGKDELFGADLRCRVQLLFEGRTPDRPRKKKATYSVGTHHTFTVVREDDD
jgi:hypothetical protein